MRKTRRQVLLGAGTTAAASLAGCIGDGSSDSTGGGESGGQRSYEVGHGDFRTTVSAATFPDMLYFYCVQSGWMNWPSVMSAFEETYGSAVHDDDRSSGEALQHMRSHSNNMTHSGYNGGYTYGIVARNDGFTQAYKPAGWEKVPSALKTDDGHVTATRRVTTAVTYRKDIYEERGLDEPTTWADLLQPEITQDLALQTPQAAVGLAAALSVNNARGGSMENLQPVIDYYKQIQEGGAEFTDNFLAQFSRGEYATFVRYDYSGLDLKYNNDEVAEENVGVALLSGENGNAGALNMPYGYALLQNAPNPEAGKVFMDYVLSLEGQQHFLDAYVRPIRSAEMELPDEFIDATEYDRTEFQVDYDKLVDQQQSIIQEITRGANL
ncbi:extracellular solute-binding protein [Haloarcula pellucida]|uniref:ABC transporter substrate-binding protein n=1 Tax=Haloarcula pellucida TaxID=1427151 RepID=A0A830GKJ8_9EURY|nr:extracellular solute-binding protein [Halomicroarcula pellucida]MBX0348769.1 extracellular solute-binding protein [Halomicroarcula pellucida]GGN91877.1 ABC transporter substrate-binding protein [Halomicroarcula pellucida]